jgi:23S rRNA pseudouridine2457 synthase
MSPENYQYYKIYKPYGMLSQFTNSEGRPVLKELHNFPDDVYPVGRLDADSEGLLLLTNDKALTDVLLNPLNRHEREYWVQVEGQPNAGDLKKLEKGLRIKGRKTLPALAEIMLDPAVPPRNPPIRFRKNIPESWIRVILTEGKNRQVRRMTASIGYPTLRLIRVRIENIMMGKMEPGDVSALDNKEINHLKELKRLSQK